jgi:alpha-methylacyl-CoA racemase
MTQGPLAGVRVVELAGIGPAPFAAMMLSELGADVIRVDRPGGVGFAVPWQYDLTNRGRPSVCVDLKSPEGVDVVRRLSDQADAFIEGMRPGVTERLGLGPADLLGRNPRLVYGRMTGWGQTGPAADRAGHDINYLAATGVLAAIGSKERPAIPANLLGDYAGGSLYLVIGILAALHEAASSGQGQVVDAAIVDGVSHLATAVHGLVAAGMWSADRGDNLLDGGTPFYDVYETRDGEFMAVGPLEPKFYDEFVRLLASSAPLPERTDVEQWPTLRALIAGRFAERTQAEWTATFVDSDACVEPVIRIGAAGKHPHLADRTTMIEHDGLLQPAPAPRFSRTTTQLGNGPERPGHSSREALLAWGISDVDRLIAGQVVVQTAEEETP